MQLTCQTHATTVPAGGTVEVLFSLKAEPGEVQARRPLNLSLVIDRSGSMGGVPLRNAIKAGQDLVEHLGPNDLLSVVIYDDDVETILAHQPVTDQKAVRDTIGKIRAGGCTNLHGGWKQGSEHVRKGMTKGQVNRVLLLTDGYANVGETNHPKIIAAAKEAGQKDIATTTLGFGNHFQEDLLIGMARESGGNFYYIQSVEEAVEVFDIEMQTLESLVARNLVVTIRPEPGVKAGDIFNNFPCTRSGNTLDVQMGDVYGVEGRQLGLTLNLEGHGGGKVATLFYRYETVKDGNTVVHSGELDLSVGIGDVAYAAREILGDLARMQMARVKDQAVELADKGDYVAAVAAMRAVISAIRDRKLDESFDVAEEVEALEHYAKSLEGRKFDGTMRKELRDQAWQGQSRNRGDLKLRGAATTSSAGIDTVQEADVKDGVLLKCVREAGKLRVRVISDGYNSDFNVQFPRSIREDGVTYVAEKVEPSGDGTFYRAVGTIKRVLRPGEAVRGSGSAPRKSSGAKKASAAPATAADLETTNVVDGVLVQCVPEGKKLRARVVSDGFNPDWNIRFPRSIRELGVLYVVEEIEEAGGGGSYIAYGKIKRLVQV